MRPEHIWRDAPLRFTEYVVDSEGSIAFLFDQNAGRTGIYWLEFADGSAYIGQSRAVASRLTAHRRRWRGEISMVRFAPCSIESLDEQERAMIWELDRQKRSLRNKMLTISPGGLEPITFTTTEGHTLSLPWDRSARGRLPSPYDGSPGEAADERRQRGKAEMLQASIEYAAVRDALAYFIDAAVPSPAETAHVLWTLTAMPATSPGRNWRRLATLNAGRLEVVYFLQVWTGDRATYPVRLNVSPPDDTRRFNRALMAIGINSSWSSRHKYSNETHVQTIEVPDPLVVQELIQDEYVADLAYRLVVQYLRLGANLDSSRRCWRSGCLDVEGCP